MYPYLHQLAYNKSDGTTDELGAWHSLQQWTMSQRDPNDNNVMVTMAPMRNQLPPTMQMLQHIIIAR
jgi:hypothetical protein